MAPRPAATSAREEVLTVERTEGIAASAFARDAAGDALAASRWNLARLPRDASSPLRHSPRDVAGVTTPMLSHGAQRR